MIEDFVCPEDTNGPLDVPPDSPVPPTVSVSPLVPPYTDAPPTCTVPPPNPALPPCVVPDITVAPPVTPSPSGSSVRPRSPSPPKAHIKKPPNSFMLFRQEQRPLVVAQYGITDSAAVNKILGQMWKFLSETEKEKYHRQQREESDRHYTLHPEWRPTKTVRKRKSDSQTGTEEPKKRQKKKKRSEETAQKSKDGDDDSHTVRIPVMIPTKSFCTFWEEQRSHLTNEDTFQLDGLHKKTVEQMVSVHAPARV
ncbi:transcription factor 7-like 1-A [Thalassophryne amazonica]|uniref:transcription factor 7-like 1-A n=1 Tax=Thalassophryne amazonica TaxID=390379 RepID=UPI00147114B9|nr:transcription factor 7-like 1-A [Thalassophryne amazonica]